MPAKKEKVVVDKKEKKAKYIKHLNKLLDTYPKILLVTCSNVGSNHMQKIRTAIRGDGILLMGKNTLVRKVIRDHLQSNPDFDPLLPHIKGNIGFVFTSSDPNVLKEKLQSLKVEATAKAGAIAPNDVVVKAGNTGLEPTQTSFLQALNIASKINKGQVEILSDVALLKKGDKVGQSEAALLAKLDIKPFLYGLVVKAVYEGGFVYDQKLMEFISNAELLVNKLRRGIQQLAAVSLAVGYPTAAAVPHALARGFQNMVGISLGSAYTFKQADLMKNAPVAAAPAATTTTKKDDKKVATKEVKEEKKEEEKKEEPAEEVDLSGFDIFG